MVCPGLSPRSCLSHARQMSRALWSGVRHAVLDAWAVLQPVECAGCSAPDRALCDECRSALTPAPRLRSIEGLNLPVWAAATYGGVLRRVVLAGKDHGRVDALRALAPLLIRAIAEATAHGPRDGAAVELAWVPSTNAALRRRGFDPVLTVIRAARLPHSRVLVASGRGQQKALDRASRHQRAGRQLRAVGRLEGRRFVLVDDVVTTGATIRAAVAAIHLGGGDVVAVCCLGTVDLRNSQGDTGARDH